MAGLAVGRGPQHEAAAAAFVPPTLSLNFSAAVPPSSLGASGLAVLATSQHQRVLAASGAWTARGDVRRHDHARHVEDDSEDPHAEYLAAAESHFFGSSAEKDRITASRRTYPRRKPVDPLQVDPLTGEEVDSVKRRIMGFGLGFEKIFATTSIKLPISAYTIFVELHVAHNKEVFSRCFNGMHTLFDLKKWIFEKLLVPSNAYDLSYAEPGKAVLNDQMRLLTTQDSLDTRTFATTRAVHGMYRGIPGVHSIDDIGVTRLYLRLQCRHCGDLLNSLQTCRRYKTFASKEPIPDSSVFLTGDTSRPDSEAAKHPAKVKGVKGKDDGSPASCKDGACGHSGEYKAGVPGHDPAIEDIWYKPDEKKHCLFHCRGYEYFEAARTHGGAAELARIYISCGKEPSKKLRLQSNVLSARGGPAKISY